MPGDINFDGAKPPCHAGERPINQTWFILAVIATPFLYAIDPSVLDVGRGDLGIIVVAAVLDIVLLWAYLNLWAAALRDRSTGETKSIVAANYQF